MRGGETLFAFGAGQRACVRCPRVDQCRQRKALVSDTPAQLQLRRARENFFEAARRFFQRGGEFGNRWRTRFGSGQRGPRTLPHCLIRTAQTAALATVAAWHKRTPNSPGIPENRLLEGAHLPLSISSRSALANDLVASGELVRTGAALRLPNHESGLRGADQAVWERARSALAAAAARPPTVAELAAALNEPPRRLKEVLARAAQLQLCWRIADERFALPALVHTWAAHAGALAGAGRKQRITAAQFRDASGVGRNLSIEILEFFDRVKFTRRLGDARLLQCAPRDIFGDPLV